VLFVCAPAWAQTGPPSAQDSGSKPQASESPQTAPDSGKKPAPDQIPPALADSTKLEPIQIKKAPYPYEAREQKLQGEVVVRILVSETGDVETAEIVSGDPVLAKSALDAVKKWKFKPFIKNGKPVEVSTKLPFDFAFSENINDEGAQRYKSRREASAHFSRGVGRASRS